VQRGEVLEPLMHPGVGVVLPDDVVDDDRAVVVGRQPGGYDWVCPPAASRTIATGIPHAVSLLLDDAGHFAFPEQPEQFQRAVAVFLASQDPSATPAQAPTGQAAVL